MSIIKESEYEDLVESGRILSLVMKKVLSNVKEDVRASYLNKLAKEELEKLGARASFYNYSSGRGLPFPGAICFSANDEVVHGIPRQDKIIRNGDIIGIDIGSECNGYFTDMSRSVLVGHNKEKKKLLDSAKEALNCGISAIKIGGCIGDIGYAVESVAKRRGFSVVKVLVGHGTGKSVHDAPQIPNFGKRGSGEKIVEGMVLAIEPMINMGKSDVFTASDGWTVKTKDGLASAHFEDTVLITKSGPMVITSKYC